MVVLSAAVLSRNGKALVARQFVEMSRMRIEGLLAAFPKLISGGAGGTQHTFVETDSVRYVYQPVETLYLLLITNKASNIVEDLETLRLLSKVLSDVAGGLTAERVGNAAFEIVFAFDEAIAVGGSKESVSLRQIQTNLEMESHEEKLALLIKRDREIQAKKDAAAKAAEIRERQRNAQKSGAGPGGMQGMGGGSSMGGIGSDSYSGGGGGGGGGPSSGPAPVSSTAPAPETTAPRRSEPPRAAAKGMKLGGGGRMGNTLAQLAAEANLAPEMLAPRGHDDGGAAAAAQAAQAAAAPQAAAYPLTLSVDEKLSVALSREGVVETLEVKGTLSLTANVNEAARCQVQLALAARDGMTFQTHPKIAKAPFDEAQTLTLKDARKGFPVGRAVGVLRWSYAAADEKALPLSINCWPEDTGDGNFTVSIEYERQREDMTLLNVDLVIPTDSPDSPDVLECSSGQASFDRTTQAMVWHFDSIDASNATGTLEFVCAGGDDDAFFPLTVSFRSDDLYCALNVTTAASLDDDSQLHYEFSRLVHPESYTVQ